MSSLTPRETMEALMAANGLTIKVMFVPYSQSRNVSSKWKSLNWRVTLQRNERHILTTDYSAGIAHCPAYRLPVRVAGSQNSLLRHEMITHEIETGKAARAIGSIGPVRGAPILPDTVDVVASMVGDADVLDAGVFEDWAVDYGYDPDSRKAEETYRQCLGNALILRAALGEELLNSLRDAAREL